LRSEELSREFYRHLGAQGLAGRTRPEWDAAIVASLVEMIPPAARVLDVGCGYGRITLPLAQKGYRIEGLDHSPELLAAARERARAEALEVTFTLGPMTGLGYEDSSFAAVICLWSTFNELLEEHEQLAALREMWRVLKPGGLALIEGRPYTEASEQEIATGVRRGPDHRVDWDLVEGILNPHYRHDETSLSGLCSGAGIGDFEATTMPWGGRERLVLRLRKPPSR
jgi:SAM-dependent methyltransferase